MEQFKGNSYKILKLIHILFASIWIGAGISVFFLLTVVLNEKNFVGILLSIHYIDLLIVCKLCGQQWYNNPNFEKEQ
jgi:hypothetical protein